MKRFAETIREVFTFQLTPQELINKGEEAANLNKEISNKEHSLAVFRKERKAEIDSLRGDLNHVLRVVDAKAEDREVECQKIYDFETKKILYVTLTGEILKERLMEERESQLQFDTVKMNAHLPIAPAPQHIAETAPA